MKKLLLLLTSLLMIISFCACQNGEVITPDGMKVAGRDAGNDAVQYTFFYPEDWQSIRDSATIELQFDCNESSMVAEYATISVMSFDLSSNDVEMTALQYWNEKHKNEVSGLYDNFAMDNEEGEEITLDETPAVEFEYTGDINEVKYYCNQVICCRYGTVYFITLVVPESNKDKVGDAIDTVVKDFKFSESIF